MRRFAILFSGAALFVAALAYWEPALAFLSYFTDRPFQGLTDAQLRAEIQSSAEAITLLGQRASAISGQGDPQGARQTRAAAGRADNRLSQLRIELSLRADLPRYKLIGAFLVSFIVFFLFFRSAYLESRPGERSRERARVRLAHESRETNLARDRSLLAERLGRIDQRLLRVEVGRSVYRQVVDILGPPTRSAQDRGTVTLTYLFEIPGGNADDAEPESERVAALILLREGVVVEIKVETAPSEQAIPQTA